MTPDINQWRDFVDACETDHPRARLLLTETPALLYAPGTLGETPLHFLCIENFIRGVEFLLDVGADPDALNEFGQSPLQECTSICSPQLDNTAVIRALLAAGADPYHFSKTDPCAWHTARARDWPPLKAIFEPVPPPTAPHETCDFLERTIGLG